LPNNITHGEYTFSWKKSPPQSLRERHFPEARANLLDALKLVRVERDLAEKTLSPDAVREVIELVDA
jgi:hypothetical protein